MIYIIAAATFAGSLLSAAQSFPNLTTTPASGTSTTLTAAQTTGDVTALSQALTMSLTSTSSDSDNDFLEMCRASTLLAELEDDDELPEPDEETDDNEDDLKDDDEYDDVMVADLSMFTLSVFTINSVSFEVILPSVRTMWFVNSHYFTTSNRHFIKNRSILSSTLFAVILHRITAMNTAKQATNRSIMKQML